MKKLLSLILSLILCLGFIVSCEKEEAISSSNESSSQENATNEENTHKINLMIDEEYKSYTINSLKTEFLIELDNFATPGKLNWIFTNFDDFSAFKEKCSSYSFEEICESELEDCIVYAYLHKRSDGQSRPRYGRLSTVPTYTYDIRGYVLIAEDYAVITESGENSFESPIVTPFPTSQYVIDIVLIPKSDLKSGEIGFIDLMDCHYVYYESTKETQTSVNYIAYSPFLSKAPLNEPSSYGKWERIEGVVTPDYFEAYENHSASDGYFHENKKGNEKAFGSYSELFEYLPESCRNIFNVITEETFEQNFVVLLNEGDLFENQDVYYTDFKEEKGCYTITRNLITPNFESETEEYKGISFCVIPRDKCNVDPSTIEIKIIEKEYFFDRDKYESSCRVKTEE